MLESLGSRVMISWEIINDDLKEKVCYLRMDDWDTAVLLDWDTAVLLTCLFFFFFSLNKNKSKMLLN